LQCVYTGSSKFWAELLEELSLSKKPVLDFLFKCFELPLEFATKLNDSVHSQIMTFKSYAVKIISRKATEKASTMRNCWVPGMNNLGSSDRWAFAEFTAMFEVEAEFSRLIFNSAASGRE
jgi:hypothetical protein